MSICKVHTVEIMHCLESDGLYGSDVRAQLDGLPIWEEYRHQKHDLFMSRNETKRQDYFLTYGEGYGPAGNRNMLEDATSFTGSSFYLAITAFAAAAAATTTSIGVHT